MYVHAKGRRDRVPRHTSEAARRQPVKDEKPMIDTQKIISKG